MSEVNNGRVLVGGLLAGLVINIGEFLRDGILLADSVAAALEALGLGEPSAGDMLIFTLVGFAFGIVTVWLYAAIRPRFGPGPRTAVVAGLAVWVLVFPLPSITFYAMGMFPGGWMLVANVWGLVEMPLAAVVGAWIYHEGVVAAAA